MGRDMVKLCKEEIAIYTQWWAKWWTKSLNKRRKHLRNAKRQRQVWKIEEEVTIKKELIATKIKMISSLFSFLIQEKWEKNLTNCLLFYGKKHSNFKNTNQVTNPHPPFLSFKHQQLCTIFLFLSLGLLFCESRVYLIRQIYNFSWMKLISSLSL